MKLDHLIKFFKHISLREGSHGIHNAFRFKAVTTNRKKGILRPARYIIDGEAIDDDNHPDDEAVPIRRKRTKRRNEAQLNPNIFIDNEAVETENNEMPTGTSANDTERSATRRLSIGIYKIMKRGRSYV
jgi:hypothetical protein